MERARLTRQLDARPQLLRTWEPWEACEQGWADREGLGGLTGENLGFRGPRREVMRDAPPPPAPWKALRLLAFCPPLFTVPGGQVVDAAHYTRLQGPRFGHFLCCQFRV